MAIGRVASRGTAVPQLSPEEIAATQARLAQRMGVVPASELAPDPAADIQRNIMAVPVMQEMPPRDTSVPFGAAPPILTEQDVNAAVGTPFQRQIEVPVVDAEGNQVIDPRTGLPAMRMVGPQEYNEQLQIERAGVSDQQAALSAMAEDTYWNSKDAIKDIITNNQNALFDASARQQVKMMSPDEIDNLAERATTDLALFVSKAKDWMFNPEASVLANLELQDGSTTALPVGTAVAFKEGLDDTALDQLSVLAGVSYLKALTQAPTENKKNPTSMEGTPLGDSAYYNDMVTSFGHFLRNGLKGTDFELSEEGINNIAKGMLLNAAHRGDVFEFTDPKTGRKILEVSREVKKGARELNVMAEALLGDPSRSRSSITPQRGGNSFRQGKPQRTAKSLDYPGIVTTAADLTKDILGSNGTVFRAKDVGFKELSLALIMQEQFVVTDPKTKQFLYSTHPFADREGLGKNDYDQARLKAKRPDDFDPNNSASQERYRQLQDAQAASVMGDKLANQKFQIQNAKTSPGVRFTGFSHAINNQRFFPTNFDTDYMSNKTSTRDMMGLAAQDPVIANQLFDVNEVEALKRKAVAIFNKDGVIRHNALEALTPQERAAIGTMINAVINYHSAVAEKTDPNITAYPEGMLVNMYNVDIAEQLAEVGRQYNAFLADPMAAEDNIISLLAGMEKGESMGSKNLWDDMYNVRNEFKKNPNGRSSVPLTHHGFDDGNQNGIFLQSLFFGSPSNALRLGTFNPNLSDMRTHAMQIMRHNLDKILSDNMDDRAKAAAFQNFFAELMTPELRDKTSKKFFKAPLMQHSYGKDASMFGELLFELLSSDEKLNGLVERELINTGAFASIDEAAQALSDAVELTLKEVIDPVNARIMKSIGRFTGILNVPLTIENVTGDTSVFSPVSTTFVNKRVDNTQPIEMELGSGRKVLLKKRAVEEDTFLTPDGEVSLPTMVMQYDPSKTKGTQKYWSSKEQKYNDFNSPLGSSQMRNAVVLPIQALDGDLVKWTTIFVNKNKKTPVPILWVHDSIISTPGGSLIYRNAYNNIAIRGMSTEVGKMGKKFEKALRDAHRLEKERVLAAGNPVGIGPDGHYPALGAILDEVYNNLNADFNSFKERMMKRNGDSTKFLDERVESMSNLLKIATQNGWVEPDLLTSDQRNDLAVTPKQFAALTDAVAAYLDLLGPTDKLTRWANGFSDRVKQTYTELIKAGRGKGGIAQMTYGATGERVKLAEGWRKQAPANLPPMQSTQQKPEPKNYLQGDEPIPF
jgi:hypothetical protein